MKTIFLDKKTSRALTALMLPVVLQNLLGAIVNSADVFMLSSVSQSALSASSLAAQITFVLSLFHWSITTGTTILAAQYYGRQELDVIRMVQGLGVLIMLVISTVFCISCLFVPQLLMRIFTGDPELIALGAATPSMAMRGSCGNRRRIEVKFIEILLSRHTVEIAALRLVCPMLLNVERRT